MHSTNDVFTRSFQVLASTVREFQITGRACLGATLKPRLYQQHFDEKLLGFRKFGDFLRAAEAAGYVKLTPTPGGDIGISLQSDLRSPEAASPSPTTPECTLLGPAIAPLVTSHQSAPVRVRQDLWNAFNSLSDNWVYDPVTDTAFKDNGMGGWAGQSAPSRPNTIPIPSGRERVIEWMRSFANMQDSDVKAQLSSALDRNAGLYEYNNLTSSKGLLRLWSRFHIQNVIAAIEAWAALHKIQPKNVASPLHLPSFPVSPRINAQGHSPSIAPSEFSPPSPSAPAPLNARLESLIDNLINDLISLRGLLQVIGPKQ